MSARTLARSRCSAASAIGARELVALAVAAAQRRRTIAQPIRLEREQFIDLALAVGKRVHADADALEERQVQIGQRRRFRVLNVTPALDPACRTAGDDD